MIMPSKVEFKLPNRSPASIADMLDGQTSLAENLEARAAKVDGEIARLDNDIAETKDVLGTDLQQKIAAVEENFKTTVRSYYFPTKIPQYIPLWFTF